MEKPKRKRERLKIRVNFSEDTPEDSRRDRRREKQEREQNVSVTTGRRAIRRTQVELPNPPDADSIFAPSDGTSMDGMARDDFDFILCDNDDGEDEVDERDEDDAVADGQGDEPPAKRARVKVSARTHLALNRADILI